MAQLGEHLVRNEGVVGSNPIVSTRFLTLGVCFDSNYASNCLINVFQVEKSFDYYMLNVLDA